MPFRSPHPAGAPVTTADGAVQQEVINGLHSADPVRVKETVGRYWHPDMHFTSPLADADGRWSAWRLLHANNLLFDIRIEHHSSMVDQSSLLGLIWFDQVFRPRVPLLGGLLPEVRCPTFAQFTWVKQPDGSLAIKELEEHVSTMYLPNLMWPLGPWVHANLVKPTIRVVLDSVFEAANIATALQVFVQKQLSGKSPSALAANATKGTTSHVVG